MYGASIELQNWKRYSSSFSFTPHEALHDRRIYGPPVQPRVPVAEAAAAQSFPARSFPAQSFPAQSFPERPIVTGVRSRWDRWHLISPPENPLSRPIDVALSLLLLALFLPVFVLIALAVSLDDGGPVIFAQRRVGRNGRAFRCLKFRSMRVDAQQVLGALLREDAMLRALWERDHKLPRDPRITRVGRYLRLTSLDELPQLVNVLRGEMSIVGPRPIVEAEIARYGRYIHHYYAVRPGLTGLWQVSGRSSVTYRRRIAADITYVRGRTLALDARILAATIPAVVLGRGSC